MSRTTMEIPMKTNNIDGVLSIISNIVTPEKFAEKIVDGETVWMKGDGVLMQMQCFSATFTGHSVVIQAWMKDAIAGESNLEGFVAMFPKKKMKKLLLQIQDTVIRSNM